MVYLWLAYILQGLAGRRLDPMGGWWFDQWLDRTEVPKLKLQQIDSLSPTKWLRDCREGSRALIAELSEVNCNTDLTNKST